MGLLSIHPSAADASTACAHRFVELMGKARWAKRREALEQAITGGAKPISIALSGGSSPEGLFRELNRASFDWRDVHVFWVDERHVPLDDAQSNYRMARELWLDPSRVPMQNIHPVPVDLPPQSAAEKYAQTIREVFHLKSGQLPQFDVIHRGMGSDGHTASLFPGDPLIEDHTGIAAATYVKKQQQWRVTLLPGVLEAARHTLVLAPGADKREVLSRVLHGPYLPELYPAQIAARTGSHATWFIDEAAAGVDALTEAVEAEIH